MRGIDHKALVFLQWSLEHQNDIKRALCQKLYDKLVAYGLPAYVHAGVFRVSLMEAAERVVSRLAELCKIGDQVDVIKGRDPLLKGTDIEIHRIAALIEGGMPREEVLADYPSLNAVQVEFAVTYAAAYARRGSSYPKISAKAALRRADFSALDPDT